jgi:hypothetical protein
MRTLAITVWVAGLLVGSGLQACAGNWTGNLQAGAGYWAGETTYSIGGEAWTPEDGSVELADKISELTFPYNVPLGTVGGALLYKGRLELHGRVSANLSDPSTKMEDSDWGVFSEDSDSLDIYSESDVTLSAVSADVGVRYWFRNTASTNRMAWSLGIGPSLYYEKSDWTVSNVDQWYPSQPRLGHEYQSGEAATYSATTVMPYVDFCAMLKFKKLSGRLGVGVGPALVQDEDDHILRQKRSTADLAGIGVKGSLEAKYDFTRHLFAQARLSALLVSAEGTQTQEGYGGDLTGWYAEIDETYYSASVSGALSIGLAF